MRRLIASGCYFHVTATLGALLLLQTKVYAPQRIPWLNQGIPDTAIGA